MPTDAPNGLLNQWVVSPGKARKAASVKSDDIKPDDDKPADKPAKSDKAK